MAAARSAHAAKHVIRKAFTQIASAAFAETPGVGPMFTRMVDIIRAQNNVVFTEEFHGAIRLGLPEEMGQAQRFFHVLGMEPTGFYDLSKVAKPLPVAATAFRPQTREEIEKAPFRMFTSLFQIRDTRFIPKELGDQLEDYFRERELFSPECMELIEKSERDGGLSEENAHRFVEAAVDTFRYNGQDIPKELYDAVIAHTDYGADVVVGSGHLNHLTPNTVDIKRAYNALADEFGAERMLGTIQGPAPLKDGTTLQLRQSSFKAPPIPTTFKTADGRRIEGSHTACFGEFEQRGVALTPEGRDALELDDLPDSLDELFDSGLAFYTYQMTDKGVKAPETELKDKSIIELLKGGYVSREPVVYEDFLAASARAIFSSTVRDDRSAGKTAAAAGGGDDKYTTLVSALGGTKPADPDRLYEDEHWRSIDVLDAAPNFPAKEEFLQGLPPEHPSYDPSISALTPPLVIDPSRASLDKSLDISEKQSRR